MKTKSEKARYTIEWDNKENVFVMRSPKAVYTKNIDPRKLANQAFNDGADEVAHMYDLTILDRLIIILSVKTETKVELAS